MELSRLGNPWSIQDPKLLTQDKLPNVVFIMETKLDIDRIKELRGR